MYSTKDILPLNLFICLTTKFKIFHFFSVEQKISENCCQAQVVESPGVECRVLSKDDPWQTHQTSCSSTHSCLLHPHSPTLPGRIVSREVFQSESCC